MPRLALVRHGQSEWNLQNRFTGWWDADLTEKGEAEAKKSGEMLKACDADFRAAFTSVQTRAIRTLWIALTEMDRVWMPVTKHWRLNERHYGGLTGLNKAETADKHGEDQVHIWRRSYDIPPPPMEAGSEFDLAGDPRYKGIDIPNTESLKLTLERVLPYWEEAILPQLEAIHAVGIPFLGHLGMLPQHVLEEGGYRIKGRDEAQREALLADARALGQALGLLKRHFHIRSLQYKQIGGELPIRLEGAFPQRLAKRSPFGQLQHDAGAELDAHPRSIPLMATRPVFCQVRRIDRIHNQPWSLERVGHHVDCFNC